MRQFALISTSHYGPRATVRGPLPPVPDGRLAFHFDRIYRSHLPLNLDDLTFLLPKQRIEGPHPDPLQPMYHMGDFFLVTEPVRDLFMRGSDGQVEVRSARTVWPDGSPVNAQYWALKVRSTSECIVPEKSMCFASAMRRPEELLALSDMRVDLELQTSLAPEFANVAPNRYVSFADQRRTKSIELDDQALPAEVLVFEPTYWPGRTIADLPFRQELRKLCASVDDTYWELPLKDVEGTYQRLCAADR